MSEAEHGLLTAEESAALFAAMQDGSLGAPEAESVRLGTSDLSLRRAQTSIDSAAVGIARALKDAVLRASSSPAEIVSLPSDISPCDPRADLVWTMRRGERLVGLVGIGQALASFVLDRRLGVGESQVTDQEQEQTARPLSALDRRMLEPLPRAMMEAVLASGICGHEPITLSPGGPDGEGALGLRIGFTMSAPFRDTAEVWIADGAIAVGDPRAQLGRSDRERIASRLGAVEVEMIAVLGRTRMDVRALLELDVGKVIRLDGSAERPVAVCVDGVTVMRGMPRVHDGNLAIEVTEHPAAVQKVGRT